VTVDRRIVRGEVPPPVEGSDGPLDDQQRRPLPEPRHDDDAPVHAATPAYDEAVAGAQGRDHRGTLDEDDPEAHGPPPEV